MNSRIFGILGGIGLVFVVAFVGLMSGGAGVGFNTPQYFNDDVTFEQARFDSQGDFVTYLEMVQLTYAGDTVATTTINRNIGSTNLRFFATWSSGTAAQTDCPIITLSGTTLSGTCAASTGTLDVLILREL